MKRILCVILVLLCFLLAACSGLDSPSVKTEKNIPPSLATEEIREESNTACATAEPDTEPEYTEETETITEETAGTITEETTEATTAEITEETTESAGRDYTLNTNTKKFHYPDCRSAAKIKDSNRKEYHGTREELIAMGYSPCGNCDP